MSHFDPLEPEKRPVFGHQRKKPNRRLRRHRNFGRFGTHLSPVALFVSELRPVFRRESVFTPDEYVFTGLVVRMYRFDVTACAEARRLDNYNDDACIGDNGDCGDTDDKDDDDACIGEVVTGKSAEDTGGVGY